ncbi:hypothetical protein P167DRAFT_574403 [Morchella conica CCBAS932]|uniref:Uncharacterized protein n=1 Tax=Morchella conica CCBAS932 TaxID=1392247 RepID=A0A3N4KPI1_9PEZI|nr:hypothetical protein P167DRAFT_574403 [Morchella conica CCBAS932]
MYRELFRTLANLPHTLPPKPFLQKKKPAPEISPLAFIPSERLLSLVCRAEDLPDLIAFEETVLCIYEKDPARRDRCFIANHPDVTPSHEDIWRFTVECNVYIASMHSAVRKLKVELDAVVKELRTTWLAEREAWRCRALKAVDARDEDCQEDWEEDLWIGRVQKIDEMMKMLYDEKD